MNTVLPTSESNRRLRARAGKRRSGSAMVEFAIVVPFLLVLTMGLVQYGMLSNASSVVTNLTREGARYGAVHATETDTTLNGTSFPTDTAIKRYIQQVAEPTTIGAAGVPDDSISISPAVGDPSRKSGNPITVTITYDMRRKLFLPVNLNFSLIGLDLSRFGPYSTTSVMIIE
jgi:Flp pilus assembly protein TadG